MKLRAVGLACATLLLGSCAPAAWTKSGASLEEGDRAFESCQRNVEAATPDVNETDFDLSVRMIDNRFSDFGTESRLERTASRAALSELETARREHISERSRQCMFDNGWESIEDPR